MKQIFFVLALMVFGCGQTPPSKPVDQQALGKEMAAFRVACSHRQFLTIQNSQVKNLFEFECFPELDAYLNRLDKLDPVETLCTPTSLLLQLRKTQDNGSVPWMIYHSQRWVLQTGHSGWAEAARAIACFDMGEDYCDCVGWNSLPPWNQGQEFLTQGLKYAEALKTGDPGWPLLDYSKRACTSAADKNPILDCLRKNPREIALYASLNDVLQAQRPRRVKLLKSLARDSADCYALLFTLQLRGARRRLAPGAWEWESLQKGFEKLLQEHPNALGVRNAYAVAALAFEDQPLAIRQAALLGYHWDPDFWGSLREYQEGLGVGHDHHLDDSPLPALKFDKSIAEQASREFSEAGALGLLNQGLWVGLETFLRELPEPGQRCFAAQALEDPEEEKEVSYRNREALLRNWQTDRPESPLMATALGGFYISYAWLARGTGYANTVSDEGWKKFRDRLQTAAHFLNVPVTAQTDALTLAHKLKLCYAGESFDRKVADRLGLEGARRGLEGVPVLQEYFQCLLPRWHGEPGDLKAACDWLRQQTGRDDAYYIMADLAIHAEGFEEVLDPEHPAHVDWKRVVQSYLGAAKEHRTSPHWAHVLLWDAYLCDQRSAAKALVPFLPAIDSLSLSEEPVCLVGAREWAEGKIDLVAWDDQKYRFKTIGSKRQKSSPSARMGVAVEVNKPLMFGTHMALFVHSPPLTTVQGFPYSECAVIQDLMPRGDLKTELVFAPGRQEELLPGTYRLVLHADGKVVHSEVFELTP